MRVRLSIGFLHTVPILGLDKVQTNIRAGAILYRSYGYVTLHAVGAAAWPRTIMPLARGVCPSEARPT